MCSSDLARQQQEIQTDTGFNEFDFHALAAVYCQISGIELPGTADGGRLFFQMLRRAMQAWSRDELHAVDPDHQAGSLETWQQFHDRVHLGMQSIYAEETEQTVLVVSSGGAMAMAVSQVLGCGVDALIDLNMQTRNTGIHQFFFNPRGFQLAGFNALPHLQRKDRLKFLTYT